VLIRKATTLALASLMLANCATAPGEESFCSRNTALCVVGGVAIAAIVVFALAVATGDKDRIGLASDVRLKRDVRPVGVLPNGLQLYSFRYWNDDRTFVSVMAQDVLADERFRHAVFADGSGYYMVNLDALGLDVAGSRSQFFEAGRSAVAEAEPVAN
jgi:hypothetical protein